MDALSETRNKAQTIAQHLTDGLARQVVALDVSQICSWCDTFVIGTVNSQTHLQGLIQELHKTAGEKTWVIRSWPKKSEVNDWTFVDLGDLVVHLFTEKARDFYELDRLWYQAEILYQSS